MNPVDIKISTYIDFDKNNNKEDSRFRVGDNVRISTFFFAKDYIPNWSEEVFVITKVKKAVPWAYVISDLISENIFGTFY